MITKQCNMKRLIVGALACIALASCAGDAQTNTGNDTKDQGPFPYRINEQTKERKLSAAMHRSFHQYDGVIPKLNDLHSQFKFTKLKGFDYNNGDGTISRRDPSKIIHVNGMYYMWYTKRDTPTPPMGAAKCTETIPSTDWDLSEIWYATSEDGFTWKEQGVAITRPPKPNVGWRSVSTADILVWKGKYYLYYQGFLEASGKKGDYCPVAMSYADSPDGPWTPVNKPVIENGPEGSWDQYAIHDPYPLVHNGKIYLYFKSAFNRSEHGSNLRWVGGGLAMADSPMGPFKKHPLNPVLSSGHEVALFPYKKGVAALCTTDGNEHNTIQYAEDWVNFEVKSVASLLPVAAGSYVPDAFTDTKDGRGITWGVSHFAGDKNRRGHQYKMLGRFDCDLSQDINDMKMKTAHIHFPNSVFFSQKLTKKQKQARMEAAKNEGK